MHNDSTAAASPTHRRRWSDAERAVIAEEYARGVRGWPERVHARLPHRTVAAIKTHAVERGLVRYVDAADRRVRARRGRRIPGSDHYASYGDAPTVPVKITMPEPLAAWLDEYARQRNVTRSAVYEDCIGAALGMMWDWLNEEYGTTMPYPPGQYVNDSEWQPDETKAWIAAWRERCDGA